MAKQVSPYRPHGVIALEEGAMVYRHCLERIADGQFAVVNVEFHDPFSDPEKLVLDTVTPFDALKLTAADEAAWEFFPTIIEAIDASRVSMADYSEWMKNARDY